MSCLIGRVMRAPLCSFLIILFTCGYLAADQVTLKNGDRVTGSIVKKDAATLTLNSAHFGTITMPWAEVDSLQSDGTLYVSGQIGRDLKTQKVPEDFDAEVRQVLDNIGIILREAKMTYGDVVSVQVYLTDMSLFQRMNNIYTTYFKTDRPSRTTVGVVKLAAPEAHVEITVTAHH